MWRASRSTHTCAGTTAGPISAVEKTTLQETRTGRVQNTPASSSLHIAEHSWNCGALNLLFDAFLKQEANYFPNASYSWSALASSQGRGLNECVAAGKTS